MPLLTVPPENCPKTPVVPPLAIPQTPAPVLEKPPPPVELEAVDVPRTPVPLFTVELMPISFWLVLLPLIFTTMPWSVLGSDVLSVRLILRPFVVEAELVLLIVIA